MDGAVCSLPLAVVAGKAGGVCAVVEGVVLGADDGQRGGVGELVAIGVDNGGVGGVVSVLATAETPAVVQGSNGLSLAVREDGLKRSAGLEPSPVFAGESGAVGLGSGEVSTGVAEDIEGGAVSEVDGVRVVEGSVVAWISPVNQLHTVCRSQRVSRQMVFGLKRKNIPCGYMQMTSVIALVQG